ncbi:hypothetical protein SEA_SMEADLEY_34 [Mycobacterium phage Smeadley]|uniref:Lipoprotein n=1 Tax=Mycobacterium phage Smeadley TaxID=1673873 RepID=A0A0H4TJQ3_9CAUD|nr:hypothetical protein AVT31_gp073 [Mycobacterium phage Smeadley]AKQ07602.1 hypothetical protein SEA_SMEADLEY_34 [Mycobacterium phage Smeadley]
MKKFIAAAIAAIAIALGTTACDGGTGPVPMYDDGRSGLVIGPGGLGVDLGGGMHINPSTGGIGFGVPI